MGEPKNNQMFVSAHTLREMFLEYMFCFVKDHGEHDIILKKVFPGTA